MLLRPELERLDDPDGQRRLRAGDCLVCEYFGFSRHARQCGELWWTMGSWWVYGRGRCVVGIWANLRAANCRIRIWVKVAIDVVGRIANINLRGCCPGVERVTLTVV